MSEELQQSITHEVPAAPEGAQNPVDSGTQTPTDVDSGGVDHEAREAEEAEKALKRGKNYYARKIDTLTRERAQEREEKQQLLRILEQYRGQPQQPQPQQQGDREPTRDQFSDYETYLEKRAEWVADRRAEAREREIERRWAERQQAAQAEHQATTLQREVKTKLESYAKESPGFYDAINSHDVQVPPPAAMALLSHKDTGPLMEYMGKHPEFVESLHGLHPMQQAIAVGELASSLKRAPQISKAPPPGQPVGKPGSSGPKDVKHMSLDEYYDHITKGRGKK